MERELTSSLRRLLSFRSRYLSLNLNRTKRFDRDAISMPASASVELREGLIRLALALDVLDLVFRLPRLGRALARLLFSEI